jgi:hypothetical protein
MTTRFGRVYFGGLLGLGVVTYMTTPLVYAMVLYASALHLPIAVLAGVGFGLGRSRPLLTGLRGGSLLTPSEAARRFDGLTDLDRFMGVFIAVTIAASLAVQAA